MDKRDFVLSPNWSRRCVIAFSLLWAAQVGLAIWLFWLDRHFYIWLPIVVQAFFGGMLFLAPPQSAKLEVSDEGLYLTRLRGVGHMLRWDSIVSVRLHERSEAARVWSAIIEDSNGHVVRVPRVCRDTAEIVGILRQHLPESVFQVW